MPFYESTFIARPDLSAQQAEALAARLAAIISQNGGAVAKTEYWGLRNLAYRIKKHRKGHYHMFALEAAPETVKELERNLRLEEDVLRYLTVKVDSLEVEPSPLAHSRGTREEKFSEPRGNFRGARAARAEQREKSEEKETTGRDNEKPGGGE